MKDIINRMNRQPTDWKEISVNHISDKGLITRIYFFNPTIPQQNK